MTTYPEIEAPLIEIIRPYIDPDAKVETSHRISRDLNVTGYDSWQLREEIEAEFAVDLSDLIEGSRDHGRTTFLQRLLRIQPDADMSIAELADFIRRQQKAHGGRA